MEKTSYPARTCNETLWKTRRGGSRSDSGLFLVRLPGRNGTLVLIASQPFVATLEFPHAIALPFGGGMEQAESNQFQDRAHSLRCAGGLAAACKLLLSLPRRGRVAAEGGRVGAASHLRTMRSISRTSAETNTSRLEHNEAFGEFLSMLRHEVHHHGR